GKLVAYNVKKNNADEATMHLVDVASGKVLPDAIEGADFATASWTPGGDGFYYTKLPPVGSVPVAERPGFAEIRFHAVGSDPAKDRLVREKTGDPTKFVGATLSRDGRWLFYAV